jgi:hypothetical protein
MVINCPKFSKITSVLFVEAIDFIEKYKINLAFPG